MSFVLEFLAEANDDVTAAVEWYEGREFGLGARFRQELESVCSTIVRILFSGKSVLGVIGVLTCQVSHTM
jgi:hypothetical protein